jgi:hypothetical protein
MLHVFQQMAEAIDQALAAGFRDTLLQHWIGGHEIGGRQCVQHLAGTEFHHILMVPRDA